MLGRRLIFLGRQFGRNLLIALERLLVRVALVGRALLVAIGEVLKLLLLGRIAQQCVHESHGRV